NWRMAEDSLPKFEERNTDFSPARLGSFAGNAREPFLKLVEWISLKIRALQCPGFVVSSNVSWIHAARELHCAKGGQSKKHYKDCKSKTNGAADFDACLCCCHPIQKIT